jgi:hypothetical protein
MKSFLAGLTGAAIFLCIRAGITASNGPIPVAIQEQAWRRDVRGFGLNLGLWSSWGAEQLSGNVLKNPGFEGVLDRAIVVVEHCGPSEFSDDTSWLGRPDDFWKGATFDVRTGASAGRLGRIAHSLRRGPGALPLFVTDGPAPPLEHGDAISVTRREDGDLPTQWSVPVASRPAVTVSSEVRPGSSGVRSLALSPVAGTPVQISSYLDSIGNRAGKLLPVEGSWRVAFWVRALRGTPQLTVGFQRQGSPPFFSQSWKLGSSWQRIESHFDARDSGPPGTLELRFSASSSGPATLLLDDVELVRGGDSAFRREAIGALQLLHPAYLRDWQGQLGDTLENRLSNAFGRRPERYRPGGDEAVNFEYGLPEFLELCRQVHADPWIVAPTTFSDSECNGLGKYLGAQTTPRFDELLVEFGNENWNPLFRPAGILAVRTHAEAAVRCLDRIRTAAGPGVRVKTVLNAQAENPAAAAQLAAIGKADMIAVAPYFLPSLDAGLTPPEKFAALFKRPPGGVAPLSSGLRGSSPEVGVYEVNLHTTGGRASEEDRRTVVDSAAAGAALARSLLESLRAGALRQCAYALAGYDARLATQPGFVDLWGLTRDLAAPDHLRPTGYALRLLNRVAEGDLHLSSPEEASVSVYAFEQAGGWSAAVVNEGEAERWIGLRFPGSKPHPREGLSLRDDGPQQISLETVDGALRLRVPAWSLTVLLPSGGYR